MPGVRWFPGATLNYADHALAPAAMGDVVAVVAESQTRDRIELTWSELADLVRRCAAGLRRLGVGPGVRVVAYAPNIPETLVAFLATASLGGVWSSCAPEFGVRAVIDRFGQIEPHVLVAIDGYRYGARDIDRREQVAEVVAALGTVAHVVHVPYRDPAVPAGVRRARRRARVDELVSGADGDLTFAPVAADHPLYVLYSSGTTGLPKAIVHGHGGIVAEHLKVMRLHNDLGPGKRFFWFTTTGWMMWNYLVSALLTGATIVLFDGDPGVPVAGAAVGPGGRDRRHRVRHVGVVRHELSEGGADARARRPGVGRLDRFATCRPTGSAGSPRRSACRRRRCAAAPTSAPGSSAGRRCCRCAPARSPPASWPARSRRSIPTAACARPASPASSCSPSRCRRCPIGFWNDPDGSRYRAAYFEDFPGVWRHGDWVTFSADGSCVITGRSDATLNRGGVRLGTSDFYTVVEGFEEVADSLVVHVEDDPDVGRVSASGMGELVLFVALRDGVVLDDELAGRIKRALASELSPRHVPDSIEVVPVIPRTLSGKKLELPVKRILAGADPDTVASRDSLADPTALDHFHPRNR